MTLLDLVLSQIIRPVLEGTRASGILALVDLGRVCRMLEFPVLCHAAMEPSRVAFGAVATDFTTGVCLEFLLLDLLLLF